MAVHTTSDARLAPQFPQPPTVNTEDGKSLKAQQGSSAKHLQELPDLDVPKQKAEIHEPMDEIDELSSLREAYESLKQELAASKPRNIEVDSNRQSPEIADNLASEMGEAESKDGSLKETPKIFEKRAPLVHAADSSV